MIDPATIQVAAARIEAHVNRTPLFRSAPLSDRYGADLWIKAEHQQTTGSFKVRGAANFVHALDDAAADRGVVTASSGNHGIGVATAARSRGIDCTIFLPSGSSQSKIDQISRLGATIETVDGTDTNLAEITARKMAERAGLTYISPYNDAAIIAGQGTIAKEIVDDVGTPNGPAEIDTVVVAVGGGGLISGISTWIKDRAPAIRIVGASALNDQAMAASIEAGEIICPPARPTLADGTAGGLDDDTITFDICRALVDEWISVSEPDIARAVTEMVDDHHQLIEGAAGVAIAAATQLAVRTPGATIVAVSCGANISSTTLRQALELAHPRRDAGV